MVPHMETPCMLVVWMAGKQWTPLEPPLRLRALKRLKTRMEYLYARRSGRKTRKTMRRPPLLVTDAWRRFFKRPMGPHGGQLLQLRK